MDKEKIQEQIERHKEKAKIFLENYIPTFIENIKGDYFFCDILSISDDYIIVRGFAGRRKCEEDKIYFVDIKRIEEYKVMGK